LPPSIDDAAILPQASYCFALQRDRRAIGGEQGQVRGPEMVSFAARDDVDENGALD
jgi:hypothetical protein